MSDIWIERLSEYLDGELSPRERKEAEAHLAGCETCAATLEGLRRVRARAGALTDSPAPTGLWAGVEDRIRAGRTVLFPSSQVADARAARGGGLRFSMPQLIAACLAVALVSGGTVYAILHGGSPRSSERVAVRTQDPGAESVSQQVASSRPAPREEGSRPTSASSEPGRDSEPQAVLATSTSTDEPRGETPQEMAISDLRRALARDRNRLDPATIRTLESNLAIIELAIDQAKRALAADPSNPYVREHLADTMRRKVELLQRATVLASTSPSEESR